MEELLKLITEARRSGRVILEVQMPKTLVTGELNLIENPSNLIVGTLFGYPFRDSKVFAVIS